MIRKAHAYRFRFDGAPGLLRARLDAAGPWSWQARDSAWFGEYLSTRAEPDPASLKIYSHADGGYQIDIRFEADGEAVEADFQRLQADILARLLPGIGASEVEATDTMN